jgi:hypothetical protein
VHVGDRPRSWTLNTERRRKAKINGTLIRTTLFIEIDLDNRDAFLVPGGFACVTKVPVQNSRIARWPRCCSVAATR